MNGPPLTYSAVDLQLSLFESRQVLRIFAALGSKSFCNSVGNQRKKAIKTKQTADRQLTILFSICIVLKITVQHLSAIHKAPIWLFTSEV